MADVQIAALATADVPMEYTIPASAEFVLKAVNADFLDNGAGGDWLPCVTILSDSGHVIARAVDQGVKVTAGGDAEVSWFPGVKHAAAAASTSADSYPVHEDIPILGVNAGGIDNASWATQPTIDTGCIHNAYLPSQNVQGAYMTSRMMVGPQYAIHELIFTTRTGPDHGQLWVYLASIPEDDANAGSSVNTNVLKDISTLNFVLCAKIETYTAVAAKNQIRVAGARPAPLSYFASLDFRPMGTVGTPFTAITLDSNGSLADLNGGPGPYALKLVAGDKAAASTGYIIDIQSAHRQRVDWAFS